MIIVMKPNADALAIQQVIHLIKQKGLTEHVSRGQECTIIGAVGDERVFDATEFERLPQVEKAIRIVDDWRMISREAWAEDTIFRVRGVAFGGQDVVFGQEWDGQSELAQLESQINSSYLSNLSKMILLDPFWLPNNPYAQTEHFQTNTNSEKIATQLTQSIHFIHQSHKIAIVRLRDSQHIDFALSAQADMVYLGGEVIENHHLLKQVGLLNTPVIVCKGKHHTVREWLLAAEQIVLQGNQQIILGEAGSLSLHSDALRLDVEAIAQAKKCSHLPILADVRACNHRFVARETWIQLAQAAGASAIIA